MLKNKICKCILDIFYGRQYYLTLVTERPEPHCFNLNKYVVCQNQFTILLGVGDVIAVIEKKKKVVWCP